jgi:hypothetical protein
MSRTQFSTNIVFKVALIFKKIKPKKQRIVHFLRLSPISVELVVEHEI